MFRVIIEGFETEKEAKNFLSWYEGQGEQNAGYWADEHPFPCMTDMKAYDGKYTKKEGNDLYIKMRKTVEE
jgi:hypothetical protein